MKLLFRALLCTSLLAIATCLNAAPKLSYEVLSERYHNPILFTQGLLVDGDQFYESSGLYGKSLLVSYPVAEPASTWAAISAPFSRKIALPERYFAEGLTLLNNKLYLLTWQEQTLLVYDKSSLALEQQLHYQGEGWGLATDGEQLIRTDGSAKLYFHAAADFALLKTLTVTDAGQPINQLNELEFAQGYLWANIWYRDKIVKIDPATGQVVAELDLSKLKQGLRLKSSEQVLNGIAWDQKRQGFWVTGKHWPRLFLIRVDTH